jgi:hypothetical protein
MAIGQREKLDQQHQFALTAGFFYRPVQYHRVGCSAQFVLQGLIRQFVRQQFEFLKPTFSCAFAVSHAQCLQMLKCTFCVPYFGVIQPKNLSDLVCWRNMHFIFLK